MSTGPRLEHNNPVCGLSVIAYGDPNTSGSLQGKVDMSPKSPV